MSAGPTASDDRTGTRKGLEIDGLVVRFGDVLALDGVSFAVARGQLVGFLGPNGAGKTTTMRAALGLLRPQSGTVTWDGDPIGEATRRRFGYMPEERGLYPRMKVLEQVAYFGRLAGLGRDDAFESAAAWLDVLGLGARKDDLVQNLSHGNQQRVQLAVALVHEPELLVLDEPFSGLDPVAVQTMSNVISERASAGVAVLFSSHQLDLVEDLCEDVVIIDHGRVLLSGTVTELRAAARVRRLAITWADGSSEERIVDRDSDLDELLRSAQERGQVTAFTFEPPSLNELFLDAVKR
ncbi:MAG TPA: ATP-binding cassette domain-containing protein [Acidimicrobiales bacterium]